MDREEELVKESSVIFPMTHKANSLLNISVAAAIGMPPIAVAGAVAGLASYGLNKFFRGKSKKKRFRNRRAR